MAHLDTKLLSEFYGCFAGQVMDCLIACRYIDVFNLIEGTKKSIANKPTAKEDRRSICCCLRGFENGDELMELHQEMPLYS